MKKVIIVDDESAGRKLIREYLADYPSLILIGEANNGVDAIRLVNEFKPDLIFLDIQMPGMTGFEVLPHLEEIPQIIFSTAYDQYALQAFEIHAVDYLLKPYTRERFQNAILRISQKSENPNSSLAENIIMSRQPFPARILVQAGRKLVTIAAADIIRIEAEGDYSRLITNQGTYLSSYGISKMEAKLDTSTFIRIHRSTIINLHFIESVEKHPNSYDIVLKNSDKVRVSRGYLDNIKDLIY